MGKRIGIDGDVEVASQVQQRLNILRLEDSVFVEAVIILMDSQDFADKKIMIPVCPDLFQLAFETNIGIVDDRRPDHSRWVELHREFFYFDKVESRFSAVLG